jgi:Ca-activated chloride channel family protein
VTTVGFSFLHPWLLLLAGLLPALALAGFVVSRRQQRAARELTGRRRGKALLPRAGGRLLWRLSALALLIIGAAGPCWGRDSDAPRPRGRDILVLLDISRSMLAEDTSTHARLDRAKRELRSLVDALTLSGGTRIGLIGFAGKAKLLCPLTEDYEHFRFALELAHPDYLGPAERLSYREDGAGLGTSLQAALDLAGASLDVEAQGFHEILLISDGDDLAGDWEPALQRCVAMRATVHVLGIGDPERDAPIPLGPNEFLYAETTAGERVLVHTRRRDALLHAVAEQSGGEHLSEGEAAQPLVTWFREKISRLPVRERTDDLRPVPLHRSGWFFASALVLLAIDSLYGQWRGRAAAVQFLHFESISRSSAGVVG